MQGEKLAFYGGIGTQWTLSAGAPGKVREESFY